MLEEADRLEVLPTAVDVGNPLPLFAGIVPVEHRGDRIHADAVHMVAIHPVVGAGGEERLDLVPTEIEDMALPVRMPPLLGISVFVERGPVEAAKGEVVRGKVTRNPVEHDADASLMEGVDESHEVGRQAEPGGGSKETGRLVAPASVERILHDREEFNVGETHLVQMVGQRLGELGPRQASIGLGMAPRAHVHLVHRDRSIVALQRGPVPHPFAVTPLVGEIGDDRGGVGRELGGEGQRVGSLDQPTRPWS